MYILGLTGGIASGKSAVAYNLRRFHRATTLDIDQVTNWLIKPGGELFEAYVRHFGIGVVQNDGNLNRRLVSEIIFNQPDERAWINSVSHPMLLNKARDFLVDCADSGVRLAVIEVPLLFEAGWEHLFDEIWAVFIPHHTQIERLMTRDKLTEKQALSRINSQMPVKEICKRADRTIKNLGNYHEIRRRVKQAIHGRKF